MKKIGIVTIYDIDNYGNRLQNYAVQKTLETIGDVKVETIKNKNITNLKTPLFEYCLRVVKVALLKLAESLKKSDRKNAFLDFNKNINFASEFFLAYRDYTDYDFIVVGSDQVWNPTFGCLRDFELANFKTDACRIAFSASFGVDEIPAELYSKVKECLDRFEAVSVRENSAKALIDDIGCKNEAVVLVDPTMLLNAKEWDFVAKRPTQLKTDRYVLNYFLGDFSDSRRREIESFAKENGCEIINILDKTDPFYQTGPAEFLYLEQNAVAVFTDSFHACVFSILFNRPFVVFDREDSVEKMNSRIDTLLSTFKLEDRRYIKCRLNDMLTFDYTEAHRILDSEREKSFNWLKNAIGEKI